MYIMDVRVERNWNVLLKLTTYFYTMSIALVNYGVTVGWSSPNIDLLESDKSYLPTGKISRDEASWIASVLAIGALPGNIIVGLLIKIYGRKWLLVASSIPMIVSWFLILFARNVWFLYIARVIQGFVVSGTLLTSPVFMVEIADDRVRGRLNAVGPFAGAVGILLAFTLGNYCDVIVTPIYAIVSTVVFAVLFSFFPETPYFLVRQNKIHEAEKSLRFYRSIRETESEYLKVEMSKLKSAVGAHHLKKSVAMGYKWSDFTTRPGSMAFTIASILALLNQFSGTTAMIMYTATIFGTAGSVLSNNNSAMIVGVIQLLGTFVVTPLIDRYGRRILYITSTFGTAVGLIALGLYMTLNSYGLTTEAFNWIPIVAFSMAIFTSAWAIQALPIAVTAEVLPEKLKEIGVTYAMTLLSATSFAIVKFLPIIGFNIGMFFFAAVCIICGLLIIKCLPETKGRSYQEIMDSLS